MWLEILKVELRIVCVESMECVCCGAERESEEGGEWGEINIRGVSMSKLPGVLHCCFCLGCINYY